MDASKTCCYGLILFAFVGAAALEVADVFQREVERRILDEADEPQGDAKEETTLGHEVFQLHSVLASSEGEQALGQEGIVAGTKRMVASYYRVEAPSSQFSVRKIGKDVGIPDHPRHRATAVKNDVGTRPAQIRAVGSLFHSVRHDLARDDMYLAPRVEERHDRHQMREKCEYVVKGITDCRVCVEFSAYDDGGEEAHLRKLVVNSLPVFLGDHVV